MLIAARNQLLGMAAKDPRLVRVRPNDMEDVAEYHIDVDWDKAGAMTAIGTAVCGGMLSATFIDLIFIPLFFVLVSRIFMKKQKGQLTQNALVATTAQEVR